MAKESYQKDEIARRLIRDVKQARKRKVKEWLASGLSPQEIKTKIHDLFNSVACELNHKREELGISTTEFFDLYHEVDNK